MGLHEYNRKRDFRKTPEPAGRAVRRGGAEPLLYVVQKHEASHLHYDFRLEWGGVLLSWAVPKGPSLDSKQRRLAVQVEDHPVDYGEFEGTIPEGEYGGGTVMLWDKGTWEPLDDDFDAALRAGRVSFELHGEKLSGRFRLMRMPARGAGKPQWLLVKGTDEHALAPGESDVTESSPLSVKTGRDMQEITSGATPKGTKGGNAAKPKNAVKAQEAGEPTKSTRASKSSKAPKAANAAKIEDAAEPTRARGAATPTASKRSAKTGKARHSDDPSAGFAESRFSLSFLEHAISARGSEREEPEDRRAGVAASRARAPKVTSKAASPRAKGS